MSLLLDLLTKRPLDPEEKPKQHAINQSLCIGCEACISVCDVNVLALNEQHKAYPLHLSRCTWCRACEEVCPTFALTIHYEDTEPRPRKVPAIDDFGESEKIKGLFLVGEVAGAPLVKNAVNMGCAAIGRVYRSGLKPGMFGADMVDVLIIGAGPAGISAALTCQHLGLSYLVLERYSVLASTLVRYPKGKKVEAEPAGVPCLGPLPVESGDKDLFVDKWKRIISQLAIKVKYNTLVSAIHAPTLETPFQVVTATGDRYYGQRVILAIGTRDKPDRPTEPGAQLAPIRDALLDPSVHKNQDILVVGGGNSAAEAAIALADPFLHNRVKMVHRGTSLPRVTSTNRAVLNKTVQQGNLQLFLSTVISEYRESEAILSATKDSFRQNIKTDVVFALIGAQPPYKWLGSLGVEKQVGIEYKDRRHYQQVPSSAELVEKVFDRSPVFAHFQSNSVAFGPYHHPMHADERFLYRHPEKVVAPYVETTANKLRSRLWQLLKKIAGRVLGSSNAPHGQK